MQENKLRLREPSEILRREGVSGATVNAATATATAVRKEETTMLWRNFTSSVTMELSKEREVLRRGDQGEKVEKRKEEK
ncbi:hypothetical protein HZH68_003305 [Vespula germanica]|uniref:Uncharacterized protein n=1 Tax=Vespula germanica TaxID=30212 RepID=A0A834NNU4_VESGE|nr:hypothetical protein HZH68_003305 [Vespula germanica]